jgi:FkbM family methyltransferase
MKTFLEVGACDFDNLDDLLDRGWKGVFVEPIPDYASQLRKKVYRPGTVAEVIEAAITNFDGHISMETVPNERGWMRGISHISSETLDNTVSGLVRKNAADRMKLTNVKAMRFDTLLDACNIQRIDLLQMDVEGHELVILNDYSWRLKPSFIRIEHKFVDDTILFKLLESKGYKCWTERDDIYGILL